MVDEAVTGDRPAIVKSLFQSIEHKARMRRSAYSPTNDAAGAGIDDESDIDETLPRCHIRKIGKPTACSGPAYETDD
jgi:hypothetical protein